MPSMEPVLDQLIDQLSGEEHQIPEARQAVLDDLVSQIKKHSGKNKRIRLLFICTHNSRRSQMAQIWAHAAAAAYQIPHVQSFSGGTEVTAFHPNAVRAMRTLGFRITGPDQSLDESNPRYYIRIGDGLPGLTCYSKGFDKVIADDQPFIAIMVCSEADQNCPIVPGAQSRILLQHEDPKKCDGTDQQQRAYLKTAVEIGREIIHVFRRL